ncbi:hypothetical protein [Siphonobacter sp.]|uniref:hypothetical protein n=1 Tax=Siphonobacter sp. TaxID=1869184 RepID=UPI003B3AFBB7
MKSKPSFALLVLAGMASVVTLQAQPPVGPGPGPAAFRPGPPAGPLPLQQPGLVALTTLSGTVQDFTANDESVLDGFTFNTEGKKVAVQFPPHLGQAIQAASKSGRQVTITGSSELTPEGQSMFRLVSLTSGQTVVTDTPPAAPATPPTLTPTTFKGKVLDYQLNKQGQVNGLRLSDQTLVRVPPHLAAQVIAVAPKESTVSVEGYVQPTGEGQVRLQKQQVIEASVLTVNGKSFLLR